jgi:hypothetical protein
MNKFCLPACIFLLIISSSIPLYAQNSAEDKYQKSEQPFIHKGIFLTGFSFGFANASSSKNYFDAKEVTEISLELDGLYFLNKHFGIGPLLGYQFSYEDFGPRFRGIRLRGGEFSLGAQVGYYVPVYEIFGGGSDVDFFVDAGVEGVRSKVVNRNSVYDLGLQAGTGFLFPVGKRIALQTELSFQIHRQNYQVPHTNSVAPGYSTTSFVTETRWLINVGVSLGLSVAL